MEAMTVEQLAARAGLDLEPFQRRILRAALGPERECLVLIARDNSKTTLAALLALYWLVTGPEDVYAVANSRDQAHVLLSYAKRFARELDDPRVVERFHDLRFCPDPSKPSVWTRQLRALAADAPKLHGLKGKWLIDELHAARDDEVYLAARTSSEREDSKVVVISTAAASADTTLGRLRARALAAPDVRRRGAVTDCRAGNLRALMWECDPEASIGDMTAAKRANPASWITTRSLRRLYEAVPEQAFRRYHRNEHATAAAGSWLPPGAWQKCRTDYEIEPGERVVCGVDVGGTRAATALVYVTEDLRVGVETWQGEESVLYIEAALRELAERQEIREVAFDPWHFGAQALDLGQRGLRMVEFPQSSSRMVPASERLYAAIIERRLKHPGDPVLDRHVAACVAKETPRGFQLAKPGRDAPVQVDAAVALAMAVDRVENQPEPVRIVGWL
jgi:phage terminase large subunit-like protein